MPRTLATASRTYGGQKFVLLAHQPCRMQRNEVHRSGRFEQPTPHCKAYHRSATMQPFPCKRRLPLTIRLAMLRSRRKTHSSQRRIALNIYASRSYHNTQYSLTVGSWLSHSMAFQWFITSRCLSSIYRSTVSKLLSVARWSNTRI